MSQKEFLKEMLKLYGAPWAATLFVLLAAAGILAFVHDARWIVIALMVVFLVIPAVISFFYFYHGLKPVTAINAIPHTLSFESNRLVASLLARKETGGEDEPEYEEMSTREIPYSELGRFIPGLTSMTIPLKDTGGGFLWLPLKAFKDKDGVLKAVELIRQSGKHE